METLWAPNLCPKIGWGAKGAPRGTYPQIHSPIWGPFGSQNHQKSSPEALQNEFWIMSRKSVAGECDFEVLDLPKLCEGSPKSRFSRFHKKSKMTPLGSHFETISESELSPVDQKRGSRNCFEKWYPPRVKSHPIDKPRGSWRRRLACAFSTTETTAQTATAATTATIAEIAARVEFLFDCVVPV